MQLMHSEHSLETFNAAADGATIAPMASTTSGVPAARTELLDEATREAWANVFVAHRRVTREAEKRLHDAGLPPLGWYDVMYTLYQCDEGRMKQTALAARVQVSPSGLSRLVDRMVAKGVIERREVPGDRRAAELVVTDEGIELMREIWAVYGAVLAEHFAPAVHGSAADVSRVFAATSESLEGTCSTRLAEAERAVEEACEEDDAGDGEARNA
jgi:DNA-binding MarR family transcriptional regulator